VGDEWRVEAGHASLTDLQRIAWHAGGFGRHDYLGLRRSEDAELALQHGVDGIHIEHGLTTNYPDQAPIHRAMMRQARQRIVVADHRKIGAVGTALIWPIEDLDILITDKGATDEDIAPLIEKGIDVRRA
jgi:hypothetical protein